MQSTFGSQVDSPLSIEHAIVVQEVTRQAAASQAACLLDPTRNHRLPRLSTHLPCRQWQLTLVPAGL
ncbi:hypothetical protein WJX84_002820 [Apatococcus fuscideae]|uniref:Uncharacterized protein n=1 Tax=Apatococcus fuscideae TaxID=2026836 RepID=A0AAW1SDE4_9CHLO